MATTTPLSSPGNLMKTISTTTIYDTSDPAGGTVQRPIRARSVSVSSSISQSQSSASSSSLSSLDSDSVRNIFSTHQNVTISGKKVHHPPPQPTDEIVFGVRPWKQRAAQLVQSGAAAAENLNPKAAPFVPGGVTARELRSQNPVHEIVYYDDVDSEDDAGVMYCPEVGQLLPPPPGLSGQRTPTNALQSFTRTSSHPEPLQQQQQPFQEQAPVGGPIWAPFFVAGTSMEAVFDPLLLQFNANSLVASKPQWSDEEMSFFTSQFPSKAYSSAESSEYPVASFALAVYTAFAATRGDMAAQAFLWSLSQHSLYAFTTSWSTESLDPSLHQEGLTNHVFSSIFMARFIGDLFNRGLLGKEHLDACVATLLENPFSEEHIAALGHLVVQAGPELWMSESAGMQLDQKEFECLLGKMDKAFRCASTTLIENNMQPKGYSKIWLEKLRMHFDSWVAYYSEIEYCQ